MDRRIIDYRELIAKSTAGFVGRRWVRNAVDTFLARPGPRSFLLLGEPGSGKTAVLADLVRERGYPHHFIGKGSLRGVASGADWRDPCRFAESLGYQLLRDYGGWVMDWGQWGIEVRQEVKDLQGLLVGAEVGTFRALPRRADRPVLSVQQEVERFGAAARWVGVYVETFEMSPEQHVRQLLSTPLARIAERWPEQPLVLVLDGLDEAGDSSDPERDILAMLPDGDLPANVRFLLSSRWGPHLSSDFLGRVEPCRLSEDERGHLNPNIKKDARAYVLDLAQEAPVAAMLARREPPIPAQQLARDVAAAGAGNFLYLYHYAAGLRAGDESLLDLARLPRGLDGIYADFLGKLRAGNGVEFWTRACKPVLGTLAVAFEPLTRQQIAAFSGVDEETVATILVAIAPFLDRAREGAARTYAFYHLSFGQYLVSDRNEDHIAGGHGRIVAEILGRGRRDWADCDDYDLAYFVQHLLAAGLSKAREAALLDEVLGNPGFMNARLDSAGWHMPLVEDLERAEAVLTPQEMLALYLAIVKGRGPNSRVMQRVVRRMGDLYPRVELEWVTRPGTADGTIKAALAAMQSRDTAVAGLSALLGRKGAAGAAARSVIALALGETGSAEATPVLLGILEHADDRVSWCAADGLLALDDRSIGRILADRYRPSGEGPADRPPCGPGLKQRILYVLGRMRLPEGRELVSIGLSDSDYRVQRLATDLVWLLDPVEGGAGQLRRLLGFRKAGGRYLVEPRTTSRLLQKRLVTALGRVGGPEDGPYLSAFANQLDISIVPSGKTAAREQRGLERSIFRAMEELGEPGKQ